MRCRMKPWNFIGRVAVVIIIILGLTGVLLFFLPKLRESQQLQRSKATLEESNNRMEAQIRLLESKCKRFNYDKEFVERTARELGMVKPDETVYKFYTTNNER